MNPVYDRWKSSANIHKEKILSDFQKKYREYKTFIPDLKASSLLEQQATLKPIFQDYDNLRPDEGILKSVDDFLNSPFIYLSVYEKIKNYQLLKKEFPFAWLKHYNTWEKRETAFLRMQNSLPGITIVDNLSSIAGFDFFSGASLKNYERMPSDFAYSNIQNAMISSDSIQLVTRIKSHMMAGITVPDARLLLPLRETALFSQLEEICRSNPEFSMKETEFSHISLPELVYVDGVSLKNKYPSCSEGDLPKILYQDLISPEHQVHVAISQYLPLTSHYRVRLYLLEPADIPNVPAEKDMDETKQLMDFLSSRDKMSIEINLARKMETARKDYEMLYQKHFNYEGQNKLNQRMEIFRKNISPDPYFMAIGEFYKNARQEFFTLLEPYSNHIPIKDMENLYLFYTDKYGKFKTHECTSALNALYLGNHQQYLPVLEKILSDVNSADIRDYAFLTPAQLFENLDHYFPLYHKTLLLDKLTRLFPDFLHSVQKSLTEAAALSERFLVCRTFYEYACSVSKTFGFSFDTSAPLPQGMELSGENQFQDEILGYFQDWLTKKLYKLSNMENPPLSTGYSFPICLSELDLSRLFKIITANAGWISGSYECIGSFFYLDGEPLGKNTGFGQLAEIAKSISMGQHILDMPCFYPGKDGCFRVIFLRLYDLTGVLPNDNARKKHPPEKALETGNLLTKEINRHSREYIDKLKDSISKNRESVEKQHSDSLKKFENDLELCEKIREQIAEGQKKLEHKKEELKKLRILPPPARLPAGKRSLSHIGLFKNSVKQHQEELDLRKEQLQNLERQVMDCKNDLIARKQALNTASKAERVLEIYRDRALK